jgi:ankyrin repeat protein
MGKLIGKGASINLCDNLGRTALMFASSGPYPSAVKLLLANQADPNIADAEDHFTALMYAAAEGQTDVIRILLTFKADPSLKDIDGDNALSFAEKNGHQDIVKLLLPYMK